MNTINEKATELIELRMELDDVEQSATRFTLADAIREGCKVSEQVYTWGDGAKACAMTAAVVSARSRNLM